MSQPKIVFISQWFAPEPTIVPDAIARAINKSGFSVEVLTGVPNYPSGRVVAGYRASRASRERQGDLSIRRTPLYPSHDSSALRRIANYLSWAVSASALGLPSLRRGDINVVYGSPITAALPALTARLLWGKPFILIVQDVWPDSVFATGFMTRGLAYRAATRILTRFCDATYRQSDRIVAISPGMKELLQERGVPGDKIEVVYNWADRSTGELSIAASLRRNLRIPKEDFVLLYAGNHGPAQGLGACIEGLSLSGREDCHLVMIGDGVEKRGLQEQAALQCPGRVHFVDPVQPTELAALAGDADAQLVSLADSPLFRVTVPSKLQSIMSAGQPVLAVAEGDVRSIVQAADCGVSARPQDPESIAKALAELRDAGKPELRQMGRRARTYYEEHMSAEVGRARYAKVLQDAAERNGKS